MDINHGMKYLIFVTSFIILIRMNFCMNIHGISEAICSLNRFKHVDILEGTESSVLLSRKLFKKCEITVRVLSNAEEIGSNLIGFASLQKNNKEKFSLLIHHPETLRGCKS